MQLGRRKHRGQPVAEADVGDEDVLFGPDEEEGWPLLSGSDADDLICYRCEQTLLLGLTRENACRAALEEWDLFENDGTAAALRPFPFVILCDCGAYNRVWPLIPL